MNSFTIKCVFLFVILSVTGISGTDQKSQEIAELKRQLETMKSEQAATQVVLNKERRQRAVSQQEGDELKLKFERIQTVNARFAGEIQRVNAKAASQIQDVNEKSSIKLRAIDARTTSEIQHVTAQTNSRIKDVTTKTTKEIQELATRTGSEIKRLSSDRLQSFERAYLYNPVWNKYVGIQGQDEGKTPSLIQKTESNEIESFEIIKQAGKKVSFKSTSTGLYIRAIPHSLHMQLSTSSDAYAQFELVENCTGYGLKSRCGKYIINENPGAVGSIYRQSPNNLGWEKFEIRFAATIGAGNRQYRQ